MHTIDDIRATVLDEVSELCGTRIDDADALLVDLGVDSTMTINLILALEERFGISIPEAYFQAENFASVSAISRTLADIAATVSR